MKNIPSKKMRPLDYILTIAWWLAVILAIISLITMEGARGKIGMFLFFAIIAGLLSYVITSRSADQESGQHTARKWKIVAPITAAALIASLSLAGTSKTQDGKTEAATAPATTTTEASTTTQQKTTTGTKPSPTTTHKQPSPTKKEENAINNGDMGKDFEEWYFQNSKMTSWDENYSFEWAPHIIAVKDGKAGIIQFVTNLNPSNKDGKKLEKV